jgi:hypothetical protein
MQERRRLPGSCTETLIGWKRGWLTSISASRFQKGKNILVLRTFRSSRVLLNPKKSARYWRCSALSGSLARLTSCLLARPRNWSKYSKRRSGRASRIRSSTRNLKSSREMFPRRLCPKRWRSTFGKSLGRLRSSPCFTRSPALGLSPHGNGKFPFEGGLRWKSNQVIFAAGGSYEKTYF